MDGGIEIYLCERKLKKFGQVLEFNHCKKYIANSLEDISAELCIKLKINSHKVYVTSSSNIARVRAKGYDQDLPKI